MPAGCGRAFSRNLLVAGLGLFAAQGFHGTTTRDIAARSRHTPEELGDLNAGLALRMVRSGR